MSVENREVNAYGKLSGEIIMYFFASDEILIKKKTYKKVSLKLEPSEYTVFHLEFSFSEWQDI